ncbi:MAG: sigma 54-interacting transcriptional regulator [Thermodesulfobacteriota bacterium]|nr:sigma 54-interacting transcriptional regulator [Thermodesulfobacteriota bacterium]
MNEKIRDLIHSQEVFISKEYVESIINSIVDYTIGVCSEAFGYITLWNKGGERMFGWKSEEVVLKKKPIDFFKQDDKAKLFHMIMKKVFNFGETFKGEIELIRKNGELFPAFLTLAPFKDKNNKINGIVAVISEIIEKKALEEEVRQYKESFQIEGQEFRQPLLGISEGIRRINEQIEAVAKNNFSVLIEGESGTGKELVARSIHTKGQRKKSPFIPVDCGAIPDNLIESEFFGYEKGAFTGAEHRREGLFETANNGIIFLDEISNLQSRSQSIFLRFLQEKKLKRIGGQEFIELDVRVISASNVHLEDFIKLKKFRHDLYFRINEFMISIPPLRERREDIPFLADRFLVASNQELKKDVKEFSPSAFKVLKSYDWPGNVRELKNVIRQAVLFCDYIIQPWHLPIKDNDSISKDSLNFDKSAKKAPSLKEFSKKRLFDVEKEIIIKALLEAEGNKSKACKILNIDYKTLLNKIKKYGLNYKELLNNWAKE